jgi:hypothetical protein
MDVKGKLFNMQLYLDYTESSTYDTQVKDNTDFVINRRLLGLTLYS